MSTAHGCSPRGYGPDTMPSQVASEPLLAPISHLTLGRQAVIYSMHPHVRKAG